MNIFTKTLFLCFAWISLGTSTEVRPEIYKVIKVEGTITYLASGLKMNRGDNFRSNEKLRFKSADSRAAVISKSRGRFILTQKKANSRKSNLLPAMSNISYRKGAILNEMDLRNYFQNRLVLMQKSAVKIEIDEYPLSMNGFFYITFNSGGENVAKKLEFDGDHVLFERRSIFSIDGASIPIPSSQEVTLYYRDELKNVSEQISEFNLVTPDEKELLEELKIIKAEGTSADIVPEAQAYIAQFYGKIDRKELRSWLPESYYQ